MISGAPKYQRTDGIVAQRVLAIVNLTAGHGRTKALWPEVERSLKGHGLYCEACFTSGPGDATSAAASAARSGVDLVVTVGGDGTVNEVANGLLADDSATRPALSIVSSGSGCDLVKTLGIPKGVAAVDVVARGRPRPVDVGRVTYQSAGGALASRYFVNAADLGLGAEVAERVNRSGKRFGGFVSFLGSAVVTIASARFKTIAYSSDGGEARITRAGIVFVANGQYAGGGMHFAPQARIDDGLFDVVVLLEVGRVRLLADLFPKVYRGAHLGHPAVIHYQAREVTVSSTDPLLLEVDGEQPGHAPATFTMLPGALQVVLP